MRLTKVATDTFQAYKDGYQTIVLKGSGRSGKTVSILQMLDFIANYSAKHRKLSIVSHSFPHLRDGAVYEYQKHQMRESIVRRHNKGEHQFYVGNSIINYFALDNDGNKAVGPGRDILYLNEVNRGITHNDYTSMSIRTSECVIMDYNPSSEFWLQKEKILKNPKSILIHSTWVENAHNLSKKQIEEFIDAKKKSKTSDFWHYWWKVYGEGADAVLMEERIMPLLKRVSKVPAGATQIPHGLDFGWFPDPTVFVKLWIKKTPGKLKDDLYIEEVTYQTNLHIDTKNDKARNLTDILKQSKISKHDNILAECAEPRAVRELRDAGYAIEAVSKKSVEQSIRLFHNYNIHIVGNSDNVYREFDNYRYKRDKKGTILPIPAEGQEDHSIDATRYVLMNKDIRWNI